MRHFLPTVTGSALLMLAGCDAAPVDAETVTQWGRTCGVSNLKVATLLQSKIFYLDEPGAADPQLTAVPLNAPQLARKSEIEKALPCMKKKAHISDVQIQYALARPVY